ncbi:MAG: hypothetical protein QOG53_1912 [Frankiales bacterium]|jgi:hypothetical protein|nr:hypothetical protein [Frankiales bacterium]
MPSSDARLPTLCGSCGELFWSSPALDTVMVSCPECTVAVPTPAGRFAGIRNLVAWVAVMTADQRAHLEHWLTWDEARLHQEVKDDDELESVRRRLAALDLASSPFWRQCFVFAVQEVVARPSFTAAEASITELARAVAQRALTIRSYEPRAY